MRRLTTRLRRLGEADGAVAVLMALLAVPLIGMAALVVDVGLMHYEVRQLQNGADAAALAIAQDCVTGNCDQSAAEATAQMFAGANASDGAAGVVVAFDHYQPDSVTVWASSRDAGGQDGLRFLFARILGFSEDDFVREATAAYGSFGGGGTFPLTFSTCEFDQLAAGDEIIIRFKETPSNPAMSCDGPAGFDFPGGVGWLDIDLGADQPCQAGVYPPYADGKTGNSRPTPEGTTGCTAAFFASLLGTTVLVPVHSDTWGVGSNAYYEIVGFAALELTGFKLSGGPDWTRPAGFTCPGNPSNTCIGGRLGEFVDVDQPPTGPGPAMGAYTVGLIR